MNGNLKDGLVVDLNGGYFATTDAAGIETRWIVLQKGNSKFRHKILNSGIVKIIEQGINPVNISLNALPPESPSKIDGSAEIGQISDDNNKLCLLREPYFDQNNDKRYSHGAKFTEQQHDNVTVRQHRPLKKVPTITIAIKDIDTGDEDIRYDTD